MCLIAGELLALAYTRARLWLRNPTFRHLTCRKSQFHVCKCCHVWLQPEKVEEGSLIALVLARVGSYLGAFGRSYLPLKVLFTPLFWVRNFLSYEYSWCMLVCHSSTGKPAIRRKDTGHFVKWSNDFLCFAYCSKPTSMFQVRSSHPHAGINTIITRGVVNHMLWWCGRPAPHSGHGTQSRKSKSKCIGYAVWINKPAQHGGGGISRWSINQFKANNVQKRRPRRRGSVSTLTTEWNGRTTRRMGPLGVSCDLKFIHRLIWIPI